MWEVTSEIGKVLRFIFIITVIGDRAFLVAGSLLWNSLPPDITSAPMLTVFQNRLKTYAFGDHFLSNCYQLLILYTVCSSGLAVLYSSRSK